MNLQFIQIRADFDAVLAEIPGEGVLIAVSIVAAALGEGGSQTAEGDATDTGDGEVGQGVKRAGSGCCERAKRKVDLLESETCFVDLVGAEDVSPEKAEVSGGSTLRSVLGRQGIWIGEKVRGKRLLRTDVAGGNGIGGGGAVIATNHIFIRWILLGGGTDGGADGNDARAAATGAISDVDGSGLITGDQATKRIDQDAGIGVGRGYGIQAGYALRCGNVELITGFRSIDSVPLAGTEQEKFVLNYRAADLKAEGVIDVAGFGGNSGTLLFGGKRIKRIAGITFPKAAVKLVGSVLIDDVGDRCTAAPKFRGVAVAKDGYLFDSFHVTGL